jgi:diguanylate cyclase (GGDEF)-like protein/PAS domain S-box-containing protein
VWSGFSRSEFGENTVIFEHGPGFLWIAGSGYVLMISIILGAWLASRHGSAYSRRQGRLLFLASLLPFVGNLLYQFQPPKFDGVDWSSILFSISSLLFVWALYGTRLLDLVPIAREKLIDSLSDGMIVLDMQNRIVDVNPPAARMVGSLPDNLLGRNMDAFIPLAQSLAELPSGHEMRTELEIEGTERRYYDILVSPLFEGKTSVIGRLVIFRDITERKRVQDELEKLAITDSLTGLLNRRYFFELGEKEFAKSTRYHRPLSVILLDIDFFKGINDTYGHAVGDRALSQVGVLLQQNGRETDLTARYGGEEFILLLPETDGESAQRVAERLRNMIDQSQIQIGTNLIRFTASFGVAAKDGAEPATFDQLVSQADQALYEAKRAGRNQVRRFRQAG